MGTMVFLRSALHRSIQERTQSVQNGMPTRSMGTMVFLRSALYRSIQGGRRARRRACPREAWARWCVPARLSAGGP
ncbi:hypothetical protein PSYTB_04390 [Pseudomonas amygdali pv. tabaci str. ATCC 11528]|nr:hypothetical protein PSYTB_04390 [Pseudomonas amygdali pv. tabaci str. ATCC 11528]